MARFINRQVDHYLSHLGEDLLDQPVIDRGREQMLITLAAAHLSFNTSLDVSLKGGAAGNVGNQCRMTLEDASGQLDDMGSGGGIDDFGYAGKHSKAGAMLARATRDRLAATDRWEPPVAEG